MLEIFPKFSNLDGLTVCKLTKKQNNKWVDLIMNNIIKNDIKQKDIIYFDLEFTEVWIDVIMTVKDKDDENKINKFSFELKTKLKTNITDLKTTLINLGITSWKKFKDQDEQEEQDEPEIQKDQDYYLLFKFMIEEENMEKENKSMSNTNLLENNNFKKEKKDSDVDIFLQEQKKFNFNDKIVCTLIFINFTNYICNYAIKEIKKKTHIFKTYDYRVIEKIKNEFNIRFQNLYLNKTHKVIESNQILCKISKKYESNEYLEVNSYPIISDIKNNSLVNENHNIKIRFAGPFKEKKKSIREFVEMDNIPSTINNLYNGQLSFKNGKTDSFSNNNSSNSLKSISDDYQRKDSIENFYYNDDDNDNDNDNIIEEINFIKKNINYDEILDKLDCETLDKELNSSDLYRARNLDYIGGEMLKFNKLNSDRDIEKKNNKEQNSTTFTNKVDYIYNNRMTKKYAAILVIILLFILLIKYTF
jgi:hypothetical protein